MKYLLVLIFVLIQSFSSFSQDFTFKWANTYPQHGNGGSNVISDVCSDSLGNQYALGRVQGQADYDPSNSTDLSTDGMVLFVQKIDPNGSPIWTKEFIADSYVLGHRILLDSNENIYVSASFGSSIDLDPDNGVVMVNGTNGRLSGLVFKLDSNGDYVSHLLFAGVNDVWLYDIKCSSSGFIYCTGGLDFVSTLSFSNSVDNLSTDGSKDAILVKLNLDLEKVWLKQYSGNGDQFLAMMALSDQEEVFISGSIQGTVDFDPGSGNSAAIITSVGQSRDGFIAELDSTGSFNWIYQIPSDSIIEFWGLDFSPSTGDLISHGIFKGVASFDYLNSTDSASLSTSRFILGMTPQSGYFNHFTFEGFSPVFPLSVESLSNSKVMIVGSAWGIRDFDFGQGVQLDGCDSSRYMYMLELDQNLNYSSVATFKCLNTINGNLSIKELIGSDLALFGDFRNDVNFDLYFHSAQFNESLSSSFLLRMNPSIVGLSENEKLVDRPIVYPNPSNGIMNINVSNDGSTVEIYNNQGKLVYRAYLNSGNSRLQLDLNSGLYLMKIIDGNQLIHSERFIIQN